MRILSADFLVLFPVEEGEGKNSILLDTDGVLLDSGNKEDLQARYPEAEAEDYQGILMPALVNAHCHLELSVFGTVAKPEDAPFTLWVERLMQKRAKSDFCEKEIIAAAIEMAAEQYRSGVSLLCDTANTPPQGGWQEKMPEQYEGLTLITMREIIAPTRQTFQQATIDWQSSAQYITAHASYSVIPEALTAIKEHCRKNKQIFSIHTAETIDEREFLAHFTGIFRQFLDKRGGWDGSFTEKGQFPSAIQYFDALGILDSETLLVHCTNLLEEDYAIIQKRKPAICLCPSSNEFLGVGRVNLEKLYNVAKGRVCLGTDSIASNPTPDLWQEMARLNCYVNQYDQVENRISPANILQMATINGIALLGKYREYGKVGQGGVFPFIVVNSPQISECRNQTEAIKVLVRAGRPETIIHF